MRPKLLIEVGGGVVQRVASDQEVEVYLIDHDNLREGDDLRNANTPYVSEFIGDVNGEVDKLVKNYETRRRDK